MSFGPGYICVDCKTMLRPRKNNVCVLTTTDLEKPDTPYQLWQADLWECPDCGHQVLLGFGKEAWAVHYEDDFAEHIKHADFTINTKCKALS